MKAWEVLAIAVDGELVCPDCAKDGDESKAFAQAVDGMAPLFASDSAGDEACGRCGSKLVD